MSGNPDPQTERAAVIEKALALADEIEQAERELIDSGWGGYPWEHLGDASRDIAVLIRGLRAASSAGGR